MPHKSYQWTACGNDACSFTPSTASQRPDGTFGIDMDSRYRLLVEATQYDEANNLVNSQSSNGPSSAQIWGYGKTIPIAQVVNGQAGVGDATQPTTVGHTSFEFDTDTDNWPAASAYSAEAKTGSRSVSLIKSQAEYSPGKTFMITPEQQRGKFRFSCWAKVPSTSSGSAAFNVVMELQNQSGNRLSWIGPGFSTGAGQAWKLCKAEIDFDSPAVRALLPANQNVRLNCYVWLSGGNPLLVDEFRFLPDRARMTTQTFQPLVGKLSETDANDVTTYYVYDTSNRLSLVKDDKGNIRKRYTYHSVAEQAEPTFTVAGPTTQVVDEHTRFTADILECGASTLYWNLGDGNTAKGPEMEQWHTYNAVGTYTITVVAQNPDRSPVERTLTIHIDAPLTAESTIASGPTYFNVCTGGTPRPSITVQATPQGGCGGPYTYQWYRNEGMQVSVPISGATAATYTYTHGKSARNFAVYCIITDAACGHSAETPPVGIETVDECEPVGGGRGAVGSSHP